MSLLRKAILAIVITALCSTASASDKRASFGFATSIEASGFFLNPTLQKVWISKITPDSPAERAGAAVGDVILTMNEKDVPGASAKEMKSLMGSFKPGDHLLLKVERDGKETIIDIVAGSK